jgi:hypothetical protein
MTPAISGISVTIGKHRNANFLQNSPRRTDSGVFANHDNNRLITAT